MAFNRNIPQEQALLAQLPDEMLESGLQAEARQSPFTQYLGALEMTKRVQQRKSAATTLAAQGGQEGTVVGRMMQQSQQVKPPQQAPGFMSGGVAPGTVTARELALHRAPQSLASGGIAGQPTRQQLDQLRNPPQAQQLTNEQRDQSIGPASMYETHGQQAQAVDAIRQPMHSFAKGGEVMESYAKGGEVMESYAQGGESPIERARREEERRQAYLRSRGLPVSPQEVISSEEAPLEGPNMSFDPAAYEASSTELGAPAGNRSQMIAEDQMSGYRNPIRRGMDAMGLFTGTGGYQPEAIQPRPESDWGAAGPPPMSVGSPAELPIQHPAPGQAEQEYGAIPDAEMAEMHDRMLADKVALDLDTATAAEVGETDEQRSQRFARATALATMAASFGSEDSFFKGLTKGVEGAAQVMQGADQTARDRMTEAAAMENKQMTAGQMLALKAQGLRNDLAQGVVGTDIKIKTLAADEVRKDIELGVSQMPEDEAGMARLLQSKIISMGFGAPQQRQDPGAAALASRR